MKTKNITSILTALAILILSSLVACANEANEAQPDPTLKSVENGAGRVLDNANSVIKTGTENKSKVWN